MLFYCFVFVPFVLVTLCMCVVPSACLFLFFYPPLPAGFEHFYHLCAAKSRWPPAPPLAQLKKTMSARQLGAPGLGKPGGTGKPLVSKEKVRLVCVVLG